MNHMHKDDHYIIMLVDDQTIIAEAIRRIFATQPDFEFHYCSEYDQALEQAIQLQPMIILQDLVMPGGNGMELLKLYRNHPALKSTPVAVLSVKEDPETKKEAFENGAYDYLVKLPDPNELIARVRHHAQACQADRQLAGVMEALQHSQEQTQLRNIELEKINEQKNRLLGVAAHDLRNPLGNILSLSEFLEEEIIPILSADQQEMLASIRELSEFTLKMVEDLLDVSTIESGELRLNRKATDLAKLIQHNIEINAMLSNKKNITLQLEPIPELPLINADPGKLTQVINNLIGNAVKYSHGNTCVRITTEIKGGEVNISVIDQGQGIPEEDLPKLFKPFGRANVETTAGEQSTGLGLAISRRIIEGHAGGIGVTSQQGVGSTFFFTLPLPV